MGNASLRQTTGNQYLTQDLRNYFQNDLPKFVLQSKIGNGKFMKTYIMRLDSAPIIVKVYMKLADEDLLVPAANLTVIWKTLSPAKYPNLLPYQIWMKSNSRLKSAATPIYLIRQYFNSNLYDRISTRPFLNELEKLWIVFQLFKCVEICHENGIVHGDLKPENIMCTTSNWVVLTDFSPFKPAVIPDDDPTDFQYYFDCMGRHRCYLAPERFFHRSVGGTTPAAESDPEATSTTGNNFRARFGSRLARRGAGSKKAAGATAYPSSALTPAMDVFALGCLAAEVLLDGVPLLDLPGMLKYVTTSHTSTTNSGDTAQSGADSPSGVGSKVPLTRLDQEDSPSKSLLMRITNVHLRNVIIDMTQKDPASRLSVSEYLDILQGKLTGGAEAGAEEVLPAAPPRKASTAPPLAESSKTCAAAGLVVFPSYFDSSLYPLFLKMHWNGVTPDERVNIIAQSYGELMRSIGGVEDPTGSSFLATALGGASSTRSFANTVMLAADSSAQLSISASSADAVGQSGVTSTSAVSRAACSAKASSAHFRAMMAGTAGAPSAEAKYDASSSLQDFAQCSTDELLERASVLVQEVERCYGAAGKVELTAASQSSPSAEGHRNRRVSEEDILRLGTASVSAAVNAATGSTVSESWGGVPTDIGLSSLSERSVHEGLVVVVDLLHANFRHLRFPRSKIVTLLLLARVGRYCSDKVILERAVPLLLLSLEDQCAAVRAMTVRTLRSLLVLIKNVSVVESNIFPLYIFPSLSRIARDPEPSVRIAFAESIGCFAETAKRFLDITHLSFLNKTASEQTASTESQAAAAGASAGPTLLNFPYDHKLDQLKEQVSRWIRDLMVELGPAGGMGVAANVASSVFAANAAGASATTESRKAAAVKRILLMDIMRLCAFFGQESTVDRLLTQMLTFLNDSDWELRHAFCAKIPAVCAFLGPTVTAECILPFIENAIYDVEDKVVLSAVHALTSIVQLRLLSHLYIVDFVEKCRSLVLHPSQTLRAAATQFLSAATGALGVVDTAVFILPLLRDLLRYDVSGMEITTELLMHAVVPSLSRQVYRTALMKRLAAMNPAHLSEFPEHHAPAEISAEDAAKLRVMHPYLDLAARDINTKAVNGRSTTVLAKGSALKDTVGTSPFSLLDMTSLQLPDYCIQSILVPHQKYGNFLYRPLSDEVRRTTIMLDIDEQKNNIKLRNLFGMTLRQGDSARALAVGQLEGTGSAGLDGSPYGAGEVPTSAVAATSSAQTESSTLLRRIKALEVPPLAPDTGHLMQPTFDNRVYSSYTEPLDVSCSLDGGGRTAWRPKEGVLLTTLREHTGAVNRLAVAPDQSFFASASADRTIKIWQTRQLDRVAFPRSAATYDLHRGEVLDAAPIENSHSVASVSTDGAVHVWRVDLVGSGASSAAAASGGLSQQTLSGAPNDQTQDEFTSTMTSVTVKDKSQIRYIDPNEGAALCVNHFNSDVCSIVTYATQRGGLHGWDLRAAREVMHLPLRPELGYATSMTISPERNWICMGTSKGFVSLFDIRYNIPSKLWRHSSHGPIHRLACCKVPKVSAGGGSSGTSMSPQSEGAFLFVAAGQNEAAVWGIPEGGECCKCFRSMPLDVSRGPVAPLPSLEEVALPRHPYAPVQFQDSSRLHPTGRGQDDSVQAIIGRISQSNSSYLITAGTDRSIRYWDFSAPNRCFTVSGLDAAQPKAIFDAPKLSDGSSGKLFMCYVAATPSADKILQMHLPVREGRGIVLPNVNARDAVLDLKNIDLPMKLMLSSSRDGEIKLWR